MRQRDRRTRLRAAGNVPELCGRPDSDQHVGPTAAVHTQPTATSPLQRRSAG